MKIVCRIATTIVCLTLSSAWGQTAADNINGDNPDTSLVLMTSDDLLSFPSPQPDARIQYGEDALQYGELRLPTGPGPHPVVVLIHGGCWLAEYDITHIRKLAAAFAGQGIASWTLEYRRVGNSGGGWPGTFEDIARGADHLVELAQSYPLDLDRVISVGHSAGGHLALWLANRPTAIPSTIPLRPKAVLALAPAADLAYLFEQQVCDNVVEKLMGGSPQRYANRYAAGSASERLPLGVPQHLIIGDHDSSWAAVGNRYFDAARAAGDPVSKIRAPESGHFEMIDPDSSTWPLVLKSARTLLKLE